MIKLLDILEAMDFKFSGDYVSDNSNKPITFYHGSDKTFKSFEFKESARLDGLYGTIKKLTSGAIFFSLDEQTAKIFAKDRAKLHNTKQTKIYKVKLNIKNPLDLREITNEKLYILMDAGFDAWEKFGVADNDGFMYKESVEQWLKDNPDYTIEDLDDSETWYHNVDNLSAEPSQFWEVADDISVVNKLKQMGYDGLLLLEYPNNVESVAVFNPENIIIG